MKYEKDTLIGKGRTANVYLDGGAAVKIYQNSTIEAVEYEAAKQAVACRDGLPVPEIYGVREVDGDIELRMRFIDGEPLLKPRMEKNARKVAFDAMVSLQCRMHRINAEGMESLTDRLQNRVEASEELYPEEIKKLLTRLDALDRGEKKLCHGDFHPLNILFDGETHWIIDWVDAAAGGPNADACRTYLIMRTYLSRLANTYLSAYQKASGVSKDNILAWLPIVAAARLRENLTATDRDALLKMIRETINS